MSNLRPSDRRETQVGHLRPHFASSLSGAALVCLALLQALLLSAQTQTCELYPIALSSQTLSNVATGTVLTNVFNGAEPGNFGWLTWAGSPSVPTLVSSLTPPGDSSTYVNPDNTADREINVGDWIQGKPGVGNSQNVRQALDVLKTLDLTVPVWDQTRGQGEKAAYRVAAFAKIRLLSYQLPNQNRITALFLGYINCGAQNQPPIVNAGADQTITLPDTATLTGSATDDGLPAPATLTYAGSRITGPGTVTFADANAASTTATFSEGGTNVLRLTVSDGELSASDDVTVTVNQPNRPPVADSQSVTNLEDTSFTITLTGSDPDDDSITFILLTPPAFGTLNPQPSTLNQFTYTPNPDYNGPDSFTFKVSDGSLDSAPATVSITILPVNDAPVADPQSVASDEDTAASIVLSGSDLEGNALTFILLTAPTNGTLNVALGTLSSPMLTYLPNTNFFGSDAFTFRVNDGEMDSAAVTVSITVNSINDPPMADPQTLATDEDTALVITLTGSDVEGASLTFILLTAPTNGTLNVEFGTLNSSSLTYTPDSDFNGSDTFTFQVNDSSASSASSAVHITVLPINDPPAAASQLVMLLEDTPRLITLAASDPDGDTLTFTITTPPTHGTLNPQPSTLNQFTYAPSANFYGIDSFLFIVNDGTSDSPPAPVVILVFPANDPPLVDAGANQTITLPATAQLAGTASDVDSPVLAFTWSAVSGPGLVSFSPGAQSVSAATLSAPGNYILRLTANDGSQTASDDLSVTVQSAVNQAPIADAGPDQQLYLPAAPPAPPAPATAQVRDTKGTNFWMAFPGNSWYIFGGATFKPVLSLWITADAAATGTVFIPKLNWTTNFAIAAASGVSVPIPIDAELFPRGIVEVGGIRITASSDVSVVALSNNDSITDSFLCYPVDALGSEYVVLSYPSGLAGGGTEFALVATEDATTVMVTLTRDVTSYPAAVPFVNAGTPITRQAGVPFAVVLNAGQTFHLRNNDGFDGDFTGTQISANKPIAVFSGHVCADVPPAFGGCNYLMEQMPPIQSWGRRFYTHPLATKHNGDTFLFLALTNGTEVRINGVLAATVNARQHYETLLAEAAEITATQPVLAMQFANGGNYDANLYSDPFMMWLPAADQFLSQYTFFVPTAVQPTNGFATNFVHLVVPASAVASLQLDGAPVAATNFSPLATTPMARARLQISRGLHRLTADEPFGLWVHGFSTFDAYGHTAGAILSEGILAERLTLAAATELTSPGVSVCNVATLTGLNNRALAGVPVEFQVTGANPTNGFANTDAYGQARFCYDANQSGADFIQATAAGLTAVASRGVTGVATTLLEGSVTDDSLPEGTPVQAQWSQVSGPATVTFSDPDLSSTFALFSQAGTYTLRLTANDSLLIGFDEVTVLVQTNFPPVVNAGPDQTVTLPNTAALNATATDDGLPAGGELAFLWSVVSGPGEVTFLPVGTNSTSSLIPSVSFGAPGVYVLRFTANDGLAFASDELTITVLEANAPPTVNAGPAQFLYLANRARLYGTATDDGHPVGGILTYNWTKVSGPGSVFFHPRPTTNATTLNTQASFGAVGTYVLRLTAGDTLLSASSDVTISVLDASNEFPVANAGPDQTITFTNRALLQGRVLDDGLTTVAVRTFWTKTSGPGTVTFGHTNADATLDRLNTATFSAPGTYVLLFEAKTPTRTGNDSLTVVVNTGSQTPVSTAGNLAPLVNAGPDMLSLFNDGLALNGTVSDDGLPAGYPVGVWWQKVSGPGKVAFTDAQALQTTARFSVAGTYVLRLTATDFAAWTFDELTVTAATNTPPVVNAGPNLITVGTVPVTLNGSFNEDGLLANATPTTTWSKISGPSTATFDSTTALLTRVGFNGPGTYVLRLTVSDGSLSAFDEMNVIVETNLPPVINAGPNTNVVFGAPLDFVGTVSDDGRPTGGQLQVYWVPFSGPGEVNVSPPGGSLIGGVATARMTFSAVGTYAVQLRAYDGFDRTSSNVTVFVTSSPNAPPMVDAGPNQTITLPATATLAPIVSDDGNPSGTVTASWTKVSGPGSVTFTPPSMTVGTNSTSSLIFSASFSLAGTYVLRLTVSDGSITVTDDLTVTVNLAPPTTEPPPLAEITAHLDTTTITAPTNIIGTASSAILQSYELQYRLLDSSSSSSSSSNWTAFATGTVSVVNGVLGTFDPTLLLNGLFEIRLLVTDTAGRTAVTPTLPAQVEGNMKIGNFTLSFTDLNVPVAGIPIQIIRTYDSRDKRPGDFGVGWTLDIKNIRLQKNRNLGTTWQETSTGGLLPTWCVESVRSRIVTITFPNGKVYKFQAGTSPHCQFGFVLIYPRMTFTPLPGTLGTLSPVNGNALVAIGNYPGLVDLYDFDALLDPSTPTDQLIFNPTLFDFATPEGYRYVIDEREGLQSLTDPNGNTLTVTTNGIIHSTGQSIIFQRDGLGRITNILDTAGFAMRYQYDGIDNLATFIDRDGKTNRFTYDGRHNLLNLVDGRSIRPARSEYDDSGRLTRHIDAFGKEINYTHDLTNRVEVTYDRLSHQTVQEYDSRGNIVRTIDALGGVTTATYDDNDKRLSQSNPLGETTSYVYDPTTQLLTTIVDPLGNSTRFTYNERGLVLSATDPNGHTVQARYDSRNNVTNIIDALGNVTEYRYDAQGQRIFARDSLGNEIHSAYDQFGNLSRTTNALAHVTEFGYDARNNLIAQINTRTTPLGVEGLTNRWVYDANNRVIEAIAPDGTSLRTVYNDFGEQAVSIDELGRETRFDYDELGRPVRTTFPDATSESIGYDANGRRVAVTNRLGQVTRYDNDALGRMTRMILPDGATTTNYFNLAGRVVAATDARGATTFYGYNAAGRTIALTNALGQVTRNTYNARGNQISVTDHLGRTTITRYDAADHRRQILFPDGTSGLTAYDALGRRFAETDQAGNTTYFGYDALSRLISVTNALQQVTRYEYNELGQHVAQIDANNHTTRYEYDNRGRRAKRILPLGMADSSTFDAVGNMLTHTDFNNHTTTFQNDALNRLIQKTPDPILIEPAMTYAYNALGLRTNMTDASGVTTFRYDERNRLIEKATPQGTLSYVYDANGNVTNIQSSNVNGVSVAYEYDALNRLLAVNDANLGRTFYTYDEVGNLQGFTYPNGVNANHEYDVLNRLTNLVARNSSLVSLASYAYTLDLSGHRLSVKELNGRNVHYAYDPLYRLSSETVNNDLFGRNGNVGYQYDEVGNRLARNSSLPGILATGYGFDANDRLTSDLYDPNGNTTAASIVQPESGLPQPVNDRYDFENGLVDRDNGRIQIVYDGDGNRVRKTITTTTNSVTTYYLVDSVNPTGYAQVLEELTLDPLDPRFTTPAVTRIYTYGHVLVSQDQLIGNQWIESFYGYDGQASVRFLTDASSNVTDTYDYDAFGKLLNRTGTTPNLYLYQGEQFDPDLGLYYLRARYAEPDRGRFWTMDSFEGFGTDPASLHKYTFNQNDPVNRRDPSGHFSLSEAMTVNGLAPTVRGMIQEIVSSFTKCWAKTALHRGAVGEGVGAALGGAVSTLIQYFTQGEVDGKQLLLDTLEGAKQGFLDGFMSANPFTLATWSAYSTGVNFESVVKTIMDPNAPPWIKVMEMTTFVATALPVVSPRLARLLSEKLRRTFCFPAGTEVATGEGNKAIEEIREGDLVWSQSDMTGEKNLKRLVRRFVSTATVVVAPHFGTNVVEATPDHPLWVADQGWKAAGQIQIGDELWTRSGERLAVIDIGQKRGLFTVYNFEIDDDHTYFIGNQEVLVHNACDMHHTIPREIRLSRRTGKSLLPKHLETDPDIVGKPGNPNRWAVSHDEHVDLHK